MYSLLVQDPNSYTIVVTHRPRVHAAQTNSCYRLHLLRAQGMGGCRGKQPRTCWQGVGDAGALLGFQGVQDAAALREAGGGVLAPGARGSPGV